MIKMQDWKMQLLITSRDNTQLAKWWYSHFGPRSVLGHFDSIVTVDPRPGHVLWSGSSTNKQQLTVETSRVCCCCSFSYVWLPRGIRTEVDVIRVRCYRSV